MKVNCKKNPPSLVSFFFYRISIWKNLVLEIQQIVLYATRVFQFGDFCKCLIGEVPEFGSALMYRMASAKANPAPQRCPVHIHGVSCRIFRYNTLKTQSNT
ncbi:hypothetical protein GDO81_026596 [Engystomops pustulosus]|uniref:Uncharacterized protein n=1 Tax=Engystomops pustulosus TaxID=76066 RepID=A0AAV6YFK3_ENGPU|nr:hypothetical protein GDO81_026596 [Engystomops pustulosus]